MVRRCRGLNEILSAQPHSNSAWLFALTYFRPINIKRLVRRPLLGAVLSLNSVAILNSQSSSSKEWLKLNRSRPVAIYCRSTLLLHASKDNKSQKLLLFFFTLFLSFFLSLLLFLLVLLSCCCCCRSSSSSSFFCFVLLIEIWFDVCLIEKQTKKTKTHQFWTPQ